MASAMAVWPKVPPLPMGKLDFDLDAIETLEGWGALHIRLLAVGKSAALGLPSRADSDTRRGAL